MRRKVISANISTEKTLKESTVPAALKFAEVASLKPQYHHL